MTQKDEQRIHHEMMFYLAKGKDKDWLIAEYCDHVIF